MTATESQGSLLSQLLLELGITPYKFSKELGYKSPDSIYAIINGQTGISGRFLERLKEVYPNVNVNFLVNGLGEKFINKIDRGGCGNELSVYPAELSYDHLRSISLDFLKKVVYDIEDKSIMIRARRAVFRGLELELSQYFIYDHYKMLDKINTLILLPDWQVGVSFDHWGSGSPDLKDGRSQNLLEYIPDSKIAFNNVIYNFTQWLVKNKPGSSANSAYLQDDNWAEVYYNDPRIMKLPFAKTKE